MKDLLKQFYKNNSPAKAVSLSTEKKQTIKFSLLSKIANMEKNTIPEPKGFPWINLKTLFLKSYVVIPLALLLLVGGSTVVSANSLPGETLYPLKRGVEAVSIIIAPTEREKTELKVKFAKKRIAELETLKQRGAIKDDSKKINEDSEGKDDSDNSAKSNEGSRSNSNSGKKDKFNNPRGVSTLAPAVQRRIEDDADEAHKVLDDNQRRIEREREDERENEDEGLEDGFRVEQEDTQLQTNSYLKLRNRDR